MIKTTARRRAFFCMLILCAVVMTCTVALALPAMADDANCGPTAYWSYDNKTYTLTITGSGSMYSYSEAEWPWHSLRSEIKYIVVKDGIETIGSYAFRNCTGLRSISLPSSVRGVEKYAFANCTSINSITVPASLTTVGAGAFSNCLNLVEVINHSGMNVNAGATGNGYLAYNALTVHSENRSKLTENGGFVFYTTEGADPVTYLVGWDGDAKNGNLTLPTLEGGYKINRNAFADSTGLKSVAIAEGVSSIGKEAFKNCTSLKSVYVPAGIGEVVSGAFSGCDSLEAVYFGGTKVEWEAIAADAGIASTVSVSDGHVHSYGDWVVDKSATMYEEGSQHRTCKYCSYEENAIILKIVAADTADMIGNTTTANSHKTQISYASANVNITFVVIAFVGAFVSIGVVIFTKTKD